MTYPTLSREEIAQRGKEPVLRYTNAISVPTLKQQKILAKSLP
jgi:hypothetical protein